MHQRHHAYSDTNHDPHSPHHSSSVWKMMLNTYSQYKDLLKSQEYSQDKAVKNISPRWCALDRFAQTKLSSILWGVVYTGIYYSLGIEPIFYLLLPLHFLIGPIQGATVNWCGHKIGYRNFNLDDYSKNSLPVDMALLGELYQNNHHKFGNKINFAYRWFEIDFTYQIAKILKYLKIIHIKEGRV